MSDVDLNDVKTGLNFFVTEAYREDESGNAVAGGAPVIVMRPTAESVNRVQALA